MTVRDYFNHNPAVTAVAATLLLTMALGVVWATTLRQPTGAPGSDVYFVDLNTGELFTAPPGAPPTSPWGNEAAHAHVFSCDSCGDEESRFLGYAQRELGEDVDVADEMERILYSRDLRQWVSMDEAGHMLRVLCDQGRPAQRCQP